MNSLVAAGADVIEIGMPFSNTMADSNATSLACEHRLATGTSIQKTLEGIME